jgi:hypothetical protein
LRGGRGSLCLNSLGGGAASSTGGQRDGRFHVLRCQYFDRLPIQHVQSFVWSSLIGGTRHTTWNIRYVMRSKADRSVW